MVRLARALLALLALAGAVLLAIAPPALGIDLQGGAFLELVVTDPAVPAGDALAQVRRGAESLGIDAQPRLRGDAIILEAADATEADVDRIERAVQGIDLRFLAVSPSPWWSAVEAADLGAARRGACGEVPTLEAPTRDELDAALASLAPLPADRHWLFEPRADRIVAYLAERTPILHGHDVARAEVEPPRLGLAPTVLLSFTADGRERLARATAERTGECLAIALDGVVVSAPLVHEPITGGEARISMGSRGDASDGERLAEALNAGRTVPLAIEWRHVVASIVPSWLGLPLLRALALAAALLGALAAARARASAWWLPVIPGVAGLPLTAALLGALGGTLTLATYAGATPACMAAAVVVGCAAHQGSRGGALRRRILAAWPGWLLLVGSAGAAIAMESTRGFWRGVAAGGVAALLPAVTLALLGVVAAGEVGRRGERDPASRPE